MELNIDADLEFSAHRPDIDFSHEEFEDRVGTGFNEYGVRENHDEEGDIHSVDVIFKAMEPGPPEDRNGIRITEEFLHRVAEKDYSDLPPHLTDHRKKSTFSKIGDVQKVWWSDYTESLNLMVRVPNTGSPTHTEAVSRYTFNPPSIRDGSVSFGGNYTAIRNDDREPELKDARLVEFSTTNFPGGYDDGGVAMAFAEEAVEAAESIEFDDPSQEEEATDGDEGENSAAGSFSVETETINF